METQPEDCFFIEFDLVLDACIEEQTAKTGGISRIGCFVVDGIIDE
jgi:hypothetical protein